MSDNVVPFKKSDRFQVYRAGVSKTGEVMEKEQLGIAYLRPGAKLFRLKLWMFPKEEYFIAANEDRSRYRVLCPNEYFSSTEGSKTHWNEVGAGILSGSFIRLRLHLLDQEILVCLFPKVSNSEVTDGAA